MHYKKPFLYLLASGIIFIAIMSVVTRWDERGTALAFTFTLPGYVVVSFMWSLVFTSRITRWEHFGGGLMIVAISWLIQQWLVPSVMPIYEQSNKLLLSDVGHILSLIFYCVLSIHSWTARKKI